VVQNVIFQIGYWCVAMSLKSLFFKNVYMKMLQCSSKLLCDEKCLLPVLESGY